MGLLLSLFTKESAWTPLDDAAVMTFSKLDGAVTGMRELPATMAGARIDARVEDARSKLAALRAKYQYQVRVR